MHQKAVDIYSRANLRFINNSRGDQKNLKMVRCFASR